MYPTEKLPPIYLSKNRILDRDLTRKIRKLQSMLIIFLIKLDRKERQYLSLKTK